MICGREGGAVVEREEERRETSRSRRKMGMNVGVLNETWEGEGCKTRR